jgi:hypothetical protein
LLDGIIVADFIEEIASRYSLWPGRFCTRGDFRREARHPRCDCPSSVIGKENLSLFIHKPIRNTNEVAKVVTEQQEENESLDFKQEVWKDGAEAAKDAAAFANHVGGDIIIGVTESNHTASGWKDVALADARLENQRIRQFLIIIESPASFEK